jgi:ABC-type Fe3+/spermidine/putrescine transport system ATPase subunit
MAYLEMQELRKVFGTYTALGGVSISLEEGEFLSFLGPSGCGKTTALRIIAGFLQPDSGRVVIGGEDVTTRAPNRRDIGMVFQAYSLFPNMTAAQNVAFGLKVRKWPSAKRDARVSELLEIVGLSHAVDRYPHQLSGGIEQLGTPAEIYGARAACSNASPWRVRSPSSRACCCSTSRSRHSMRSSACSCATRSGACSRSSASRPCT